MANKTTIVSAAGVRQVASYSAKGYPDEVKRQCLTLYVNGLGFRAIERCTGVNHNTVIQWVKQIGKQLRDVPESQMVPALAQIDELQTFVGSKKNNSGSGVQSTPGKQEF